MLSRTLSLPFCLALAASPVWAQTTRTTQPGPTSKPTESADLKQEVTGTPESAEDRVRTLEAQLERLKSEVNRFETIQESGGMVDMVRSRLQHRSLGEFRQVDIKPKAAPVRMSRGVRMMMPAEKDQFGEGTLFLADGFKVSQADYDRVLAFAKTYAPTPSDAHFETIVTLATHAIAKGQIEDAGMEAVRKRVTDARDLSAEGQPFYRVAELYSDCSTANRTDNGELGWLGRNDRDPLFMSAVFEMKAGEKSKEPIPSQLGLHYVEVMDRKDGGEGGDSVRVRHTMAMFTPDSPKIAERVRAGKVALVFREAEHLVHARRLMAPKIQPTEVDIMGGGKKLEPKKPEPRQGEPQKPGQKGKGSHDDDHE